MSIEGRLNQLIDRIERLTDGLEQIAPNKSNKRYRVKSIHDIVVWLSAHDCEYHPGVILGGGYDSKWAWNCQMWDRCGQQVFPHTDEPYEYHDSTGHRYLSEWIEEVEE